MQSCSDTVVGDRPGQTAAEISLSEDKGTFSITKMLNGKLTTRHVPMSNVACYEAKEVPAAPKK